MIAVTFAGRNQDNTADDIIYIAINSHWENNTIYLPEIPQPLHWRLAVYTANAHPGDCFAWDAMPEIYNQTFAMQPRSVMIAVAVSE